MHMIAQIVSTIFAALQFILNKLISKIEIGSLETIEGQKQQAVSVEWKIKSTY